jgi:hypothetical protein
MNEVLLHALASRQAYHDSHQVNDQEMFLRQVEATLIGQNPQQALATEFFNQKNSMQGEAHLPPHYQDLLGFRAGHGVVTPVLPHEGQLSTQAVQSMLNQLLVANVAQPTGLSGLQGFAAALSSRQASSRHQNATRGVSQNDILRQILLLSSPPTANRQNPS